ncbi:sensor histidine kinase [Rhizobium rosettiformans]|uniref:sensor histidine kinase n=1 Tax=Rhizobium rosettiformans TaxID=1368430 RepID=UPI0028574951|nr:HAMP domain-containing sensor histidine kinase [Rhizobium rosettiformans]MDR7026720.1 signal transduction histidine kinase [Rhizobium rosettiformans]MDR7064841.1 signal transduction histidine kinase [Rhizobium rosettiformans]
MLPALDPVTALTSVVAGKVLNAIIWIILAMLRPRLAGPKLIVFGSLCGALGFWRIGMRGPDPSALYLLTDNTLVMTGILLLVAGYLELMRKRFSFRVLAACIGITVAGFAYGFDTTPENVAIRVHTVNLVALIVLIVISRAVAEDMLQPKLLRVTILIVMALHVLVLFVRSGAQFFKAPPQAQLLDDPVQAWMFLEWGLFFSLLNLFMLVTLVMQYAHSLTTSVEALEAEVAERRRLQEELSERLAAETTLREEQYQFVRLVSHELRTPLAVISRSAEMIALTLEEPAPSIRDRLAKIASAAAGLFGLIDRFLITERHQIIGPEIEMTAIDALLEDVRQHFVAVQQDGRLKISRDHASIAAPFDRAMMVTVLTNLIDNGLKYSRAEETVSLSVSVLDGKLVFRVADKGIGIVETDTRKIGQRFYRGANTTDTAGVGIGLYSARKLIDYHAGTISLSDREGGGTIAEVRLPLAARPTPIQDPS